MKSTIIMHLDTLSQIDIIKYVKYINGLNYNGFMINIFVYISLLFSIIAICGVVYLFIVQRRILKKRQGKDSVVQQIKEYVFDDLNKPDGNFIPLVTDNVYEQVRSLIKLDLKELVNKTNNTLSSDKSLHNDNVGHDDNSKDVKTNVFYATAVNEKTGEFYSVANEPIQGESVFKFTEYEQGKCEFEIYEGAYSMIMKVPDYLFGACRIERLGINKINVEEKGIAELLSEGKWGVKKQAKVKFE